MGRRPMETRLKARANRAKSGSVNFSRRLSRRTTIKKYRSERKGRRSFDTAIEYGTVAMIATEKTRTAKSAVRACLLRPERSSRGPADPTFGEGMMTSIPQRARRRHAYIVFVDEAGFMLAPVVRRTWAPRGCTPVTRTSEPHGRISVIGA